MTDRPDDQIPDPTPPPPPGVFTPRGTDPAPAAQPDPTPAGDDAWGNVVIHGPGGNRAPDPEPAPTPTPTPTPAGGGGDDWGNVVIHGPGGNDPVDWDPAYDPGSPGADAGAGAFAAGDDHEPVVTWRPGGGTVTGTTGGSVPSGLGRSVVPGVAQSVDGVVWRAVGAVAATAVSSVVIWGACGRDGVLDDGERIFAAVAGGAALAALGFLVATVVGAIAALREISRSRGHRYGRARIAVLTASAVIAVGAGLGLTASRAADARDAAEPATGGPATATTTTVPVADPTEAVSLVDLTDQPIGTCLRWPDGPTRADLLGGRADPSAIRLAACTAPHAYEIVGQLDLPADGADYPSFEARRQALDTSCLLQFLAYLTAEGAPPVNETPYGIYDIAPSQTSWIRGDRRGICIAVPPDAVTTRTTSLLGAG